MYIQLEEINKDKIGSGFLFEIENELFFTTRDILDILERDLKLKFILAVPFEEAIKEIYMSDGNFIVFKYSPTILEISLDSGSINLLCFSLDRKVEIYEGSKTLKTYKLDITPILRKYIDNERIFEVAEKLVKYLEDKQSYII